MTATTNNFATVSELMHDETVTHSYVSDVALPGGKTLALLTLDNGLDHKKPTTLGPNSLLELRATLEGQAARAEAGEIHALAITGKPYFLIAGADLSAVTRLNAPEQATAMASLGHYTYELLADLGVPTFAFINGLSLGGGLEIALACNYRTVSTAAGAGPSPDQPPSRWALPTRSSNQQTSSNTPPSLLLMSYRDRHRFSVLTKWILATLR